ncbi:hypothetical protein RRG08_048766 [Elysia crispata]|uniref:Uncharacterized protein n=1 Tax=Elysia crispata TaxID=231223 RepID=A0AAE1AMH5_9GAST|nr:hypothetical protein RRG08_048766 [Elysia crispata]
MGNRASEKGGLHQLLYRQSKLGSHYSHVVDKMERKLTVDSVTLSKADEDASSRAISGARIDRPFQGNGRARQTPL